MRTTPEAVQSIIEVEANVDLLPFIETASTLVEEVCAGLYETPRLELIERWLSAHFYAIRDPRAGQETAGSVNASYQFRVDVGFDVTTYGQQAMRLDTLGGLAALNKQSKNGPKPKGDARIFWLGV